MNTTSNLPFTTLQNLSASITMGKNWTRPQLLKKSELPTPIFNELWKTVTANVRKQHGSSICLKLGARRGESQVDNGLWHKWTLNYLNSGIGMQFWGPGTPGKWKLDKDRDNIEKFFRCLMLNRGQEERQKRARAAARVKLGTSKGGKAVGEDEGQELKDEELEDRKSKYKESVYEEILEVKLEDDGKQASEGLQKSLPSPALDLPPEETIQGRHSTTEANSVKSEAPSSEAVPSLLSSIRNYVLEVDEAPKQPCQQSPASEAKVVLVTKTHPVRPTTGNRTFETRMGDNQASIFLFNPLTVSFQDFFISFCEAWRRDIEGIDAKDVEVKISIAGEEYRLCFGASRDMGWAHILGMAANKPESNILVSMLTAGRYCDQVHPSE